MSYSIFFSVVKAAKRVTDSAENEEPSKERKKKPYDEYMRKCYAANKWL